MKSSLQFPYEPNDNYIIRESCIFLQSQIDALQLCDVGKRNQDCELINPLDKKKLKQSNFYRIPFYIPKNLIESNPTTYHIMIPQIIECIKTTIEFYNLSGPSFRPVTITPILPKKSENKYKKSLYEQECSIYQNDAGVISDRTEGFHE